MTEKWYYRERTFSQYGGIPYIQCWAAIGRSGGVKDAAKSAKPCAGSRFVATQSLFCRGVVCMVAKQKIH